jgi:hypothetical protein
MKACRQAALAAVFLVLAAARWSGAAPPPTYDVQLDQSKFGHIDQANVPAGPGDNGSNSCVPTATMNSFQYLNTAFPTIYGMNAGKPTIMGTSATWTDAAINLAHKFMNTDPASGTTDNNWIMGKVEYLESLAPGKTTYAGMDSVSQGGQNWVQNANPTANFFLQQLKDGEDIEIGITPSGNGIGHCLTLTSLHWVDNDASNTFNAGDTLTLDGIDPAGGTPFNFTMSPGANANAPMSFNGGAYNGYVLDAALAESPVPEPAAALAMSLIGVLVGVRHRREN